jgi:hypothetical protein
MNIISLISLDNISILSINHCIVLSYLLIQNKIYFIVKKDSNLHLTTKCIK